MMILAGRIAASYGRDHNLALAYRYQHSPASNSETAQILGMRTHMPHGAPGEGESVPPVSQNGSQVGHGLIPFEDLLVRGLSLPSSGYAAAPVGHFSLGISGGSPHSNVSEALKRCANGRRLRSRHLPAPSLPRYARPLATQTSPCLRQTPLSSTRH